MQRDNPETIDGFYIARHKTEDQEKVVANWARRHIKKRIQPKQSTIRE